MNSLDARYQKFNLVKEMLEVPRIIRELDLAKIFSFSTDRQKVILAGEGSSRIFPAKNVIYNSLVSGYCQMIISENCMQAAEYNLSQYSVYVASNSGRTSEAIHLMRCLNKKGHGDITAVTGSIESPLSVESTRAYILDCGRELAVSASKSVMEQALFFDLLFRHINGDPEPDLAALADAMELVLEMSIQADIVSTAASAPLIYFAGKNNGVAEELALKANEVVRKKSAYLEGTYALHGVEEVMSSDELVILFDPFESQTDKLKSVLVDGAGVSVIAVSHRETIFPTITVPRIEGFESYLQLAAGWNLLVETGLALGINLDSPVRARKIGNEYKG